MEKVVGMVPKLRTIMSVGDSTAISTDIPPKLALRATQLPPCGLLMAPIAPQQPPVDPIRGWLKNGHHGLPPAPDQRATPCRSAGPAQVYRRMAAGSGRWDRGIQRAPSAGPAAGGRQVGGGAKK